MAPSAQLEFENPYQSTATLAEAAAIASATDELIELRAFVGPKFEHYLRKWHPRLEDPQNGDVGISWVAFFITAWWMGYRKMYAPMLIYLFVSSSVMLGLHAVFILGLNQSNAPLLAVCIATVLIQLVCMLYANAWYLQHALGQVNRLKNSGYKGNELLMQAARRGGTSVLGVIASFFACGMATLVSNVISFALVYSR
jgi:hypothetical protein